MQSVLSLLLSSGAMEAEPAQRNAEYAAAVLCALAELHSVLSAGLSCGLIGVACSGWPSKEYSAVCQATFS